MAIVIILDTIVVKRAVLEERYPGGLAAYRATGYGTHGYPQEDEHLVSFSEMGAGLLAELFSRKVAEHGIEYVRDSQFVDIALVREADLRHWFPHVEKALTRTRATPQTPLEGLVVEGSRIPCNWLEFGTWGGTFVCWFRGTAAGRLCWPTPTRD